MVNQQRITAALLILLVIVAILHWSAAADTFGSGANTSDIDFVNNANPGNAADTDDGVSNLPGLQNLGSAGEPYRIGIYEVSRGMVTKANSAGCLGITLAGMAATGGNGVNRPANGVSWNEAAWFVHWLNASQGFQLAYNFTTQPGDGTYIANQDIFLSVPGDLGFNAAKPFRNSQSHYFLVSADKW